MTPTCTLALISKSVIAFGTDNETSNSEWLMFYRIDTIILPRGSSSNDLAWLLGNVYLPCKDSSLMLLNVNAAWARLSAA